MKIVLVLAAALLLAACGSDTKPAASSPKPTQATTSAYAPADDDDATTIASHIRGCTAINSGDVAKGGPALTSVASCKLDGRIVIVDVFATPEDAVLSDQLVQTQTYYAHSTTQSWVLILADQGQGPDNTVLQLQITNQADKLFDISTSGDKPTPQPVATQHDVLEPIALDFEGELAFAQ